MIKTPTQRSLPRADWPRADQLAWQAALAPGTLLGGGGPAALLAPVTVQDLERRYACFLSFADRNGLLSGDGSAADTINEATVRAYIHYHHERVASVTLAGSIRKILRVATMLAPNRDWAWLRRFAGRLEANQVPRNKRPRVVDIRALYRLGGRLMDRADAGGHLTPLEQAQRYRNGLAVALLAASQLRLGAFARLEIGSSVSRGPSGWVIHIPGMRGTKYRRTAEKPLPAELSARIDRWITIYRPRFARAASTSRLWLSSHGAMSVSRLQQIIDRETTAAFGRSVNPHLFRDCAATTINTAFSAESHLASAVLDHIDPRVTEKHYNHAGMVEAVEALQRSLGLRD